MNCIQFSSPACASKSTNMGWVASKKILSTFCLESGGSFFLKPYPQRKKLQEWRGGLRHCGRGRPLLGGANAGSHRGDARGICRRPCLQQVCPLRPPMRPRGMPHSAQLAGAAAEPARALSRSSCRAQATRRDSGSATTRRFGRQRISSGAATRATGRHTGLGGPPLL